MYAESVGSRRSRGSRASGRYRTVSSNSEVDESLFGNNGGGGRGVNSVSRKKLTALRGLAVVSRGDLSVMKKASLIKTRDMLYREKKAKEDAMKEKKRKAALRKEMMLKLEEDRKASAKPSAESILRSQNTSEVLKKAARQMAEQEDDVKAMNRMILYANCVTIRDRQLTQKTQRKLKESKDDRRLDILMEIDRLKGLRRVEDEEAVKKQKSRQMAGQIRHQIQEREKARLLELEALEQEKQQMKAQSRALEEEELEAKRDKRRKGKEMLREVLAANREAIERKKLRVVAEAEEDRVIAAYNADKRAREEEYEAEQQRIADEKEREVARMRADQERASDKQAEKDELQARRYQEALERGQREREEKEWKYKKDAVVELNRARKDQEKYKVRNRRKLILEEKAQFDKILREKKEMQDKYDAEETLVTHARRAHRDALYSQIEENERRRKSDVDRFHEQAHIDKANNEAYAMRMQQIKDEKIARMKMRNIPTKYLAEVQSYKVCGGLN